MEAFYCFSEKKMKNTIIHYYHMTLLLFSEYRHVLNNVMTIRYITLSVGASNVMTTSVTTMQIFIQITTFEGHLKLF